MSGQKKARPKMQIGPLATATPQAVAPSLIGGFTSTQFQSQQRELRVEEIHPRPHQPRRTFTSASIEQLTQSVRNHGILQPLSVHLRDERYDLIAGERRLRAAKAAGLAEVPVRVFENLSDAQIQQLAALENLQREDLNPVDEVDAIMDILSAEFQMPRNIMTARLERWKAVKMRDPELVRASEDEKQAIAQMERVFPGLSRGAWTSFVANRLPILRLPDVLLSAVRAGELDYTKAIAIRSAPHVLYEKLMQQASYLSIHDLRKAVKEAKLEPAEVEDYQQIQGKIMRLRPRTFTSKLAKLDPSERDYIMRLLDEIEAVLDGKAKTTGKLPARHGGTRF